MKQFLLILLVVATVLGLVLGLPLLVGVWLPDVIAPSPHNLAEQRLTNGYSFKVTQYWNHVDFYSTELHVTAPDGREVVHTLDGDDAKSWRVPLRIDEQGRTATVVLGGGRVRKVEW